MKTNVLFSSLSTSVLLNTNNNTEGRTLQIVHGGISVAFNEDAPESILFLRGLDDALDFCTGSISDDEDLKYARRVIKLCKKFCNVHA